MAAIPDVIKAFVNYTRTMTDVTAFTSTRVLGRLRVKGTDDPTGWAMPTYAIVFSMVPGPSPRRSINTPIRYQTVQVDCYGPVIEQATDLWRTLYANYWPDTPKAQGFRHSGCAVISIEELGNAAQLFKLPENYPRVVHTWLVQYAERQVPV